MPAPPPADPPETDLQRPPTGAEWAALARLAMDELPVRDDIVLNVAFRGAAPALPAPVLVSEPLPAGSQDTFQIVNFAANERVTIPATLLHVSDHAYFWFDASLGEPELPAAELAAAGDTFDEIYDLVTFYFGGDVGAGVDGDPRLYILHVTPQNLCSDTSCRVLGYFNSADVVPPDISPTSNGHELFIINGSRFSQTGYFSTLVHELRHVVEHGYDQGDWDWAVEGSATLAQSIWGDLEGPLARASLYLAEPDRNLFSWPDSGTAVAYGHGFLLNQFLFQQLGREGYRAFAVQAAHGFAAVDAIQAAFNLPYDGEQLWQHFLVALALHDQPAIPAEYELGLDGLSSLNVLSTAAATVIASDVHQFGADYYRLTGAGPVTLTFNGAALVQPLTTTAPSGSGYWLAERGNEGDAQLTRPLDLRGLNRATLNYDVFHDLEAGFDFAYVSVSTDGVRWQPLAAPNMAGAAEGADPGRVAFAERFYTGTSSGWVAETIDLSPYAGQEIWLRFQVITDPIKTWAGLALDNVTVPEIGFYDFGEGDNMGWETAGFMPMTNYVPQRWSVQLITFTAAGPVVTPLVVDPTGRAALQFDIDPSQDAPILIIAGMTPQTLATAPYQFHYGP